jgi:hypothetical protein
VRGESPGKDAREKRDRIEKDRMDDGPDGIGVNNRGGGREEGGEKGERMRRAVRREVEAQEG